MFKLALTGADGLVGSRIVELLRDHIEFIPLGRPTMDITNKDAVWNTIKNTSFDAFLHLAGYTFVDKAEEEKELAYKVNVEGTRNVFEAVQEKKKPFIYISTDFVFDGQRPPYDEDSTPNPIGYYGQTKWEGEQVVKKNAMIVRIAYPYRAQYEAKRDFVKTVRWLLEQGKPIKMVTNSTFTPTFIDDIAYGLKHLIKNYQPKIIHLVGNETLSPFEAGKQIAKSFHLNPELIQPTTYAEYFKDKAKRPQYSEVESKHNNFHPMKSFSEGLEEIVKQL